MLTIGALLCGLTAVRFSAEGRFGDCVKCIFFACVLDGLDGHTARALGTSSAMGFELDSLWYVCSFRCLLQRAVDQFNSDREPYECV